MSILSNRIFGGAVAAVVTLSTVTSANEHGSKHYQATHKSGTTYTANIGGQRCDFSDWERKDAPHNRPISVVFDRCCLANQSDRVRLEYTGEKTHETRFATARDKASCHRDYGGGDADGKDGNTTGNDDGGPSIGL